MRWGINRTIDEEFLIWQASLIKKIIARRSVPPHDQQEFTLQWIQRNAVRVRRMYIVYYKHNNQ